VLLFNLLHDLAIDVAPGAKRGEIATLPSSTPAFSCWTTASPSRRSSRPARWRERW